jgi:hypothetical protein
MRKKDRSGLYMILGVLVLIVAFVFAFIIIRNVGATPPPKAVTADPAIVQQVTGVTPTTWAAVGTGGVTQPFQAVSGQPALTGTNGLPEFLYIGGEFCPNCAAERWAMLNALSRFGTFSKLSQIQSYEEHVSTFSFYGSTYTSSYVDFVPVESSGNALNSTSTGYVTLQQMTSEQQQLFNKYDAPPYFQNGSNGSIPFIDVGNKYLLQGASYNFATLLDSAQNPLTWQNIASSLGDTSSPITKDILGTSNYLTAAICQMTNQKPGNVCNNSTIQQIEGSLGKTSASHATGTSPLASMAPADSAALRRRMLN